MSNLFNSVKLKAPKRNLFNLSFDNKFSCQLGQLIPIMCEPVVPGDTFRINTEVMVRMAPMTFPIMQQLDVAVHYFYVPNRLLFSSAEDWEQFISPQATAKNPNPVEKIPPTIQLNPSDKFGDGAPLTLCADGTLMDFLGYNIFYDDKTHQSLPVQILPVNAYNLIYFNYYMDQNVSESPSMKKILGHPRMHNWQDIDGDLQGTGETAESYFNLRHRCWKKDYFTSALPFTQRGADVHLPLYGELPIKSRNDLQGYVESSESPTISGNHGVGYDADNNGFYIEGQNAVINQKAKIFKSEIQSKLYGDLTNATAATINELRKATALQRFLEISARCGSRYKEFVLGHFGVDVPDGRLQRPEFLGGGTCKMQISEVLQTSSSVRSEAGDITSPLADMAGHGIAFGKTNYCKKSFPEHGYVMAILSIVPRAGYYQGIRKDLLKQDRLDFYSPEFAHLGEQPIQMAELYTSYNEANYDPNETFGYTPRYAEYKFIPNQIHGTFKDNMDTWHMARRFAKKPTLSKEFLEVNEYINDLNRVFAVPGTKEKPLEHFYVYTYNDVRALRPMPVFGTPSII